jgi:hypothetical protein
VTRQNAQEASRLQAFSRLRLSRLSKFDCTQPKIFGFPGEATQHERDPPPPPAFGFAKEVNKADLLRTACRNWTPAMISLSGQKDTKIMTMTTGNDYRDRLTGSITGIDYRKRLPKSIAGIDYRVRLSGSISLTSHTQRLTLSVLFSQERKDWSR